MLSAFLSRIIILVFGTLYPAYASYKAVKTKNLKEYVKWMMYWIVFALFICVETFADVLLAFWMPLYYEMKILFLFWLLSPWTKGSSCLYRKFVHPELCKREKDIDDMVSKARAQGYSTLVTYGAKGLTLASKFVAEIAMKGQYTLMNQLRKSQSLNDISPHRYYGNSMEVDGVHRRHHPYYLPPPSIQDEQPPQPPIRYVTDEIIFEEDDYNEEGLESELIGNDEYAQEVSSILASRKRVGLPPLPTSSRKNRGGSGGPVYNTRSHQQPHDVRDSEDSKDEGIYATVPRVGRRVRARKAILDSNTGTLTKEMASRVDEN